MVRKTHNIFLRIATFAVVLLFAASGLQLFAANCATAGTKCGLPIVTFESSTSTAGHDVLASVQSANPSLYPNNLEFHVFYDSRSGKVSFQDASGMELKPDANARFFVVSWHDGNSTDWRYIDASLAARVPATAKAEQLAQITWAIKAATLAPRVILVGGNEDLIYAEYYVAGKAAPEFGGGNRVYNNDFHGLLATDNVVPPDAATLKTLPINALMTSSAMDRYVSKAATVSAATIIPVRGISSQSKSLAVGQSMTFSSNIGPVVWSVLEGPSAGTIDHNGVFTSSSSIGNAHVVAISKANHSVIAVSSAIALSSAPAGPTVTTNAVSMIISAGGTFNSTVNPNGASGVAGFEYSTNSSFNPAYNSSTVAVSGSTATPVSVAQTRLTPNTEYYVRAFFRNSSTNVTTFGASVSFKTFGSFVITADASAVTSSDATLNAQVNGGGLAGSVYFAYSNNNFATTSYTAHVAVPGDFAEHTISVTISHLPISKTYQFKAVFDQGSAGAALQYGSVKSFSTYGIFAENDKPNWAVSITQHGATFPGKYGTGGGPAEVWIEISKSSTMSGASVYDAFQVGSGVYTYQTPNLTVSTLSKGTTYYVRYAIKNTENGNTYKYPYPRMFTTLGPQAVSLASSFNREGFVTDGTTFASSLTTAYDGGCCSMSANLLGNGTTFAGISYTFGAANTKNVIYGAGQTIALPTGNWTSLNFLGAGVNGNQGGQSFVVHYTDGSSTTFMQSMSDWYTPQNYSGESRVVTMTYRDMNGGGTDNRTFYLYGYSLVLNSSKTLQSITLPNNSNVNIVAMTLNH